MLYLENEMIVYFDCDDTLVMHQINNNKIEIKDPYSNTSCFLTPHKRHIKLLKDFKSRGYTVVVWSAAGAKWANEVVKSLDLKDSVDLVISKPLKFVDDLPASEVLGSRIYLPFKEEA